MKETEMKINGKTINDIIGENKKFLNDMVHHPDHYNYKSMECIDIIKIMCEGLAGSIAYDIGTAIKYLYRFPAKNNPIEDLQKAKTYIDMAIKELEENKNERI